MNAPMMGRLKLGTKSASFTILMANNTRSRSSKVNASSLRTFARDGRRLTVGQGSLTRLGEGVNCAAVAGN